VAASGGSSLRANWGAPVGISPASGSGRRWSRCGVRFPTTRSYSPMLSGGRRGWVLMSLACRPDDVLVVGAGRQGVLARLPLSKVSRYCLAHAQCPALAVPPPALARELRHGRLAWAFRRRTLTAEDVIRDRDTPTA
jgi:Universal stress protein family